MGETTTPGLVELTVAKFTTMLASPRPLPAGGSATALAGALGAALTAMVPAVRNAALNRRHPPESNSELTALCSAADTLRARLVALVDADARAYEAVIAARQMPKETETQQADRLQAIQAALLGATETPLEVASLCLKTLELSGAAVAHSNRATASDAAAGALLAYAGLRAAARNIRANLISIHDAHYCERTRRQISKIEAAGELALTRTLAAADATVAGT